MKPMRQVITAALLLAFAPAALAEEIVIRAAKVYTAAGEPLAPGEVRVKNGKIIEVAKAHDIPIEENEVLAGALSHVEIGDEIPEELYKAVAEVLIFVLRLTGRIR